MAVVIACQLVGKIVGLPQSYASDVEADTTAATAGDLNIFIPPLAGEAGFITVSPVTVAATLANLVNGSCTITVSQGSGTLNVAVAQ